MLSNYYIFITIAIAYIASPGPAVFISIFYGLDCGIKKTIILLLGNTLGLGILAFISAIGIGAIIISSPILINGLQFVGALVLIYIGLKMIIKAKSSKISLKTSCTKNYYSYFKEGLLLSLTNPKPIIFFTSIYPQFVELNSNNIMIQFLILGISFMVLSFLILSSYSVLSRYILGNFLTPRRIEIFNSLSGIILIVLALMLIFNTLVK